MKTYNEHKGIVNTFSDMLKENDRDLLKDLENLGVNEKTYSLSDIEDTWDYVLSEDILNNGDYFDIDIEEEYETVIYDSGNECDLDVIFKGHIGLTNIDVKEILKDFTKELESIDENYDQKRWSRKEILDAIEYIEFNDFVSIDYNDVKVRISSFYKDQSSGTLEYSIDEDTYSIVTDTDGLWEDFIKNLGAND